MPNPHNRSDLIMVQLFQIPHRGPSVPHGLVQSDTSNPDYPLINGSSVLGLSHTRMGLFSLGTPTPGTMIT